MEEEGSLKQRSSSKHAKPHRHRHRHRHSSTPSDQETDEEARKTKAKKRKDKRSKRHEKKAGKDRDSSKKDHKKDKRRKKKRHHSDSSDDDEARRKKRRLLKEAKALLKKHKSGDDGSARSGANKKDLSEEDYFEKNKEFSAWLKEENGMYFSNLSSEQTRALFQEFVKAWNLGNLPKKYYEGIESASRSSHNWKIKDEQALPLDREEEEEFRKKLLKSQRKKFHKENEELLDELAPKATGRERSLEKKVIRREQARAREDSPELMKDGDMMGGGDDFKERLARGRARREKAAAERAEAFIKKKSIAEEKEAVAMGQLRALVDMAGGKITIPKRNNPS